MRKVMIYERNGVYIIQIFPNIIRISIPIYKRTYRFIKVSKPLGMKDIKLFINLNTFFGTVVDNIIYIIYR